MAAEKIADQAAVVVVEPLQSHHLEVASMLERAIWVVDVRDAARHSGREVTTCRSEHEHCPSRHVLTGVVTDAFDHGNRAGVAHTETLPYLATYHRLAPRRSVENDVARDHLLFGGRRRRRMRTHDDVAPGQALAQVVVGIADESKRYAPWQERAEALPGRACQRDVDGAVFEAPAAIAPRHLIAEHGADAAVDVAHGKRGLDRPALADRVLRGSDELVIEGVLEPVVLAARATQGGGAFARSGLGVL